MDQQSWIHFLVPFKFMSYPITKPLVIYDGECGICAGNLKWLDRIDILKVFDSLPYQSDEIQKLFPNINPQDFEKSLHVIFQDGRIKTESDAFSAIFLRSPFTFPIGILMNIPPISWILRHLYLYIAKNRYKLGGHCSIPTKDK